MFHAGRESVSIVRMSEPLSQVDMLETLSDRADKLMDDKSPKDAMRGRLLGEIVNLIEQTQTHPISVEQWEDHELRWREHVADLRLNMVKAMAEVMLSLEAMARHEPDKVTPDAAKLVEWWVKEGGREQCLSELPVEARRTLEANAARLPKRD